jgi:hypothetical protein
MNTPLQQCQRHPDLARDDDGERIVAAYGDSPEERDFRMKRIVACVNACAGIEDPAKAIEDARQVLRLLCEHAKNNGWIGSALDDAKAAYKQLNPSKL